MPNSDMALCHFDHIKTYKSRFENAANDYQKKNNKNGNNNSYYNKNIKLRLWN